eukprot:jgi/Mesvir1/11389/Mv10288-RA.1
MAKTRSKTRSEVYCGMGKKPANRRQGSVAECMELSQVRRYGVEAIAREVVERYFARVKEAKARRDAAYRSRRKASGNPIARSKSKSGTKTRTRKPARKKTPAPVSTPPRSPSARGGRPVSPRGGSLIKRVDRTVPCHGAARSTA